MRTFRFLLCTTWLAWLAACGPGTGGTGTGEPSAIHLGSFGASAASVCASNLGSALACAGASADAGGVAASPSGEGSLAVHFADSGTGGEVHMVIEGNRVQLEAHCQGLRFDGDWGVIGAGDARFFGSYGTTAAPSGVTAALSVEVVPGKGNAVQVTLRHADGHIVLGPVVLLRVAATAVETAACP